MTQPACSVLLPVFNAESTLVSCLRSIERQTLADFECVIIDDGSEDRSLTIASAFAAKDPRFRVAARPHEGLVPALNHGLSLCRGNLVMRMDADDLMHSKRLRAQHQALSEDPRLAAVGCHVRLFPRSSMSQGLRNYECWLNSIVSSEDVDRETFIECPLAHPTLAIRREVLVALGYRDESWPEDYDLMLRLLTGGERLAVVPQRYHLWRDGPTRLSRTDARYGIASFTRCRAHFLAQSWLRGHQRYILWGYGGTGKALRKALAAHQKTPHAIIELHPGRLGQRIHGAEVLAPEALRTLPRLPILVSVAGAQARGQIRRAMAAMSLIEGQHFVCCA